MTGQYLRQFRLEEKIGSGAMGVVYRAVDERNGRAAAVKVITSDQGAKPTTSPRFIREAEILQGFRHPNIVRFLGGGRFQGTLYIAMEYVAGGTLDDLLVREQFLPWQQVVELGIQICNALQYAHEKGVVHRDLKPSNLMLSNEGQIKLTDFGIAKDLDATALTADGRTLGTAAYMAPEQIRNNREVFHKTDLYALGCVFYQMLAGQPPFAGKNPISLMNAHLNEPPPRPSGKNPQIPRALDDLIVGLMAKEPGDRPFDAAAVEYTLTQLRDKLKRGEKIAMVFGELSGQVTRAAATTQGATDVAQTATRTRRSTKLGASATLPWPPSRRQIETALLILGLVLVTGAIGYGLWPPSARYLFDHAARKMASANPIDWKLAQRDYIEDLEARFPTYRPNEVRAWRDKIALEETSRRAGVLERPNLGRNSEPKTKAESIFVSTYQEVYDDLKARQDARALGRWNEMATLLRADTPDERPWHMLARAREVELRRAIAERRAAVVTLLKTAETLEKQGKPAEAAERRRKVVEQFGMYQSLDDLLKAWRPAARPKPGGATSKESPPTDRTPAGA